MIGHNAVHKFLAQYPFLGQRQLLRKSGEISVSTASASENDLRYGDIALKVTDPGPSAIYSIPGLRPRQSPSIHHMSVTF